MNITYSSSRSVSVAQFKTLLEASSLGERRPVDDDECLAGMLENSNLTVTAWHEHQLVGISRSVTDFYYACYLSDLAVHGDYQKAGIGKRLQLETRRKLGPKCKLILLAAPLANGYYENLGFTNNARCWVLDPDDPLRA